MQFENSDELNRYVAKLSGGVAMLSFSTGKDSLCTWLVMRKYFHTIIPFHLYRIPGLEFAEKCLDYYENFFDTHIIRMPHPALYRQLNALMFQSPDHCQVIEDAQLQEYDYDDLNAVLRFELGILDNVYMATGVRARDSVVCWASSITWQ